MGSESAEDRLWGCQIQVEMYHRSPIEFHGLHKAFVYWCKPSLSHCLVYKAGSFVDRAA